MIFYLGTHKPAWLTRTDVPLFVSRRSLCKYRSMPKALGPWALDSGGFSELSLHGRYTVSPQWYAEEVLRWRVEVGQMEWAAVQDWMCEPFITARTGLSVQEHQRRTIQSYLDLHRLAPEAPWVPVLQGYHFQEYLDHVLQYERTGIRLGELPLVGLGSVCRRQDTDMVEGLIRVLHGEGIKLHGFGFKLKGLRRAAHKLASSDSMAWSFAARRHPPLPDCPHRNCANCIKYALWWRDKALRAAANEQGELF